jgi:hypothetical protein
VELLLAGSGREGESVRLGFTGATLWGTLAPLLPLLLASLVLFIRRGSAGEEKPRRTVLLLLSVAAGLSLALAMFVVLPEDNQYKFVRTAQVSLSLLAAGGLGELWNWRGAGRGLARAAGASLLAVLTIGGIATTVLGIGSYAAWSRVPMPLSESAAGLAPIQPQGAVESDLTRAMAWLRSASKQLDGERGRGVLLLLPPAPQAPGPDYGGIRYSNRFNLQGHEGAAFSGLSLFVDRASYLVESDPRWAPRLELVRAFFEGDPAAAQGIRETLDGWDRPVFLLRSGPSLPGGVERDAGFVDCAAFGAVAILCDAASLLQIAPTGTDKPYGPGPEKQ